MLSLSLLLAIIAGAMNGSYAFALRYMRLPQNTIWLIFSVLAFLIAPWVALFLLNAHFPVILSAIPGNDIVLLSLGGLAFGIGMVLFTFSLRFVGIGVSFLLNISAGTIIGSLLPILLLEPARLETDIGILQIIGLLFFVAGIIGTAIASKNRDQHVDQSNTYKGKNFIGILLGTLSGLFTSAQGFVYSYTLPSISKIALLQGQTLLASTLPWAFIFNAAFIPYFLFFLWKNFHEHDFSKINPLAGRDLLYLLVMAIFYFGSIIVFSKAATLLGDMGSVIAWPILMIAIILTANFWGFVQKEWAGAGEVAVRYELISIGLLVVAVIILAADGYLNLAH